MSLYIMLIRKQKMRLELQKINVLRGVLLQKGNKERINAYILKLHKALKISQNKKIKKKPLQIINDAIEKSSPIFTFRRVVKAGRLYEIPVPISANRATFMSTTWLSKVSKKRSQEGSPMYKFLAPELLNILKKKGAVMEQLHTYTADGLEKNIFKKMIRKKRSVVSRSKGINAYKDILSRINQTVRSRKFHGKTRQIAFSLRRLKKRHSGRNKISEKKAQKKRNYISKKGRKTK